MTKLELAWLAGWLEGEGTFYYHMPKSGDSPRIAIQAFSVDLEPIEKVANLMGARIYGIKPRPCRGTQWTSHGGLRVELQQEPAAALMRELLPLMCSRRAKQITDALAAWETRANKPKDKPCACGCGRMIYGGPRMLYARGKTGACAMRAFRARQRELAA